jgi:hypothetical protein
LFSLDIVPPSPDTNRAIRVTQMFAPKKRYVHRKLNGVSPALLVRTEDLPEVLVADTAEWRTWLKGHHSKSRGVWLVLAKKGTTHPTTLSYDEALDEAICFGWIDGQLGRRDDAT